MLAALLACSSEGTQSTPAEAVAGPHAKAEILFEHEAVSPGMTTRLAIHLDLDPHWHVYWNGRNDTGFPVTPEFDLPPGWSTGEIRWPAPKRHVSDGAILDHIYEDTATLIVPVEVGDQAELGKCRGHVSPRLGGV